MSYVTGTVRVLAASRLVRWGQIWRERRRIKRLDNLLNQIVVEKPQPTIRVKPNTGARPKKPQDPKGTFVQMRRMTPPPQPPRVPQGAERRLSEVWLEDNVVQVPQTDPVVRRGTRGRAPQESTSLDSLNSFHSMK